MAMSYRKLSPSLLGLAACGLLLTACGSDKDKTPLPGQRISVLELQKSLEPDSAALDAQGFIAPETWTNDFWPQNGGYPSHAMQSLALSPNPLKKIWSADIGDGSTSHIPLVTRPIMADGRIFTIDTSTTLTAFDSKTGKRLWHKDIAPKKDDSDAVIGGGIAFSQGRLYVTNGYNELLVVDPASGKVLWRKPLPTASRAAPTVQDNRVFVVTLDNRLLAYSVDDGSQLWEFSGISEVTGLVGAASPAAGHDVVIPAFSSGEIIALRVENGAVLWSDNLSTTRRVGNLASLADIRGLPVLDKDIVFAVSYNGKLVAIDEHTGNRVWQREIGGTETPWVAGNHLFLITNNQELLGIGRDTGVIRWVTQLTPYKNMDKKSDPVFWTGPLLAGGRLIVAGSNGKIAEADPNTGKILRTWDAAGPVTIAPIVAGGVLYVLSDNGTLTAYQ